MSLSQLEQSRGDALSGAYAEPGKQLLGVSANCMDADPQSFRDLSPGTGQKGNYGVGLEQVGNGAVDRREPAVFPIVLDRGGHDGNQTLQLFQLRAGQVQCHGRIRLGPAASRKECRANALLKSTDSGERLQEHAPIRGQDLNPQPEDEMRLHTPLAAVLSALMLIACNDASTAGFLAPEQGEQAGTSQFDLSNAHLGRPYQLQAAFHAAINAGDKQAMWSLWAPDAQVWAGAIGCTPCTGPDAIADAFATSGPFVNRWASLAPAYKTEFDLERDAASYQFECVYVDDVSNMSGQTVHAHLNATGNMVLYRGQWVYQTFRAGLGSV